MKNPVILHSWSLGREILSGRYPVEQVVHLASKYGFAGVEWLDRLMPSCDPGLWKKLALLNANNACDYNALSICLEIGSPPAMLAEQVDMAKRLLGLAAGMEVQAVRVSLGGSGRASIGRVLAALERLRSQKSRRRRPLGLLSRLAYRMMLRVPSSRRELPPPPRASRETLQRAAWVLQPLARQARDLGMVMGLENHYGPTSHPEDMLEILSLCGNRLGVCLDFGNFPAGMDPVEATGKLAPRVVHVHFKVLSARAVEEIDSETYPAMLALLRAQGYRGMFSLESEGEGRGLEGAVAGAELLRIMWAKTRGG